MKRLILVTSPPACGKTFISKEISKALKPIVYLDKDTLIGLSNQVFKVAGEENNRSSDFFEKYIRNTEYEVVIALAMEALDYCDTVLINAPFTREIRDLDYMDKFKKKLAEKDCKLVLIWVETDKEVCHQRMIERNSSRDTWKLANWDEYISKCNFEKPVGIPELRVFKNSSMEEFNESMAQLVKDFK
ncbi:AAA family ATPase [Clostridium sp. BJN0001]|uniref:AAA family ATPase n=1 Tax=Clostridium sp. BJN0001 TaxID=2930219 RepID=UPI001FD1A139|nr:AAA family ATPase [Clostridium sp. BJN0001]